MYLTCRVVSASGYKFNLFPLQFLGGCLHFRLDLCGLDIQNHSSLVVAEQRLIVCIGGCGFVEQSALCEAKGLNLLPFYVTLIIVGLVQHGSASHHRVNEERSTSQSSSLNLRTGMSAV